MRVDLRLCREAEYAFAMHYFTGSRGHNTALKEYAQKLGFALTEYSLAGSKGTVSCTSEEQLFAEVKLPYIVPELRENTGEIEAAAADRLPKLIEAKDIRGVFHNHTTASDGANTLAEMVAAAQRWDTNTSASRITRNRSS